MNAKQEELSKIVHVPKSGFDNDIPHVADADGVLLYPTSSSRKVKELALLVLMSPGFGEPIFLPVNHCKTDADFIREKFLSK